MSLSNKENIKVIKYRISICEMYQKPKTYFIQESLIVGFLLKITTVCCYYHIIMLYQIFILIIVLHVPKLSALVSMAAKDGSKMYQN